MRASERERVTAGLVIAFFGAGDGGGGGGGDGGHTNPAFKELVDHLTKDALQQMTGVLRDFEVAISIDVEHEVLR